ncbi:MAG: hypothetical protein QNI84_08020 [Henriciella sp.]|nr:hypothetical protein [Henriciella sp.]
MSDAVASEIPDSWLTGKETVTYFAKHGVTVGLSTISRLARRDGYTDLARKSGRTLWIDAAQMFSRYCDDYQRQLHAGEAGQIMPSGQVQVQPAGPKDEPLVGSNRSAVLERDERGVPKDPTKAKAHLQALELQRRLLEANGQLVPVASVQAALANAIAEGKALHRAQIGPASERIAAMFKDDSRAGDVRAILDETFRAGWNMFAQKIAESVADGDADVFERFRVLEAYAVELLVGAEAEPGPSPGDEEQAA